MKILYDHQAFSMQEYGGVSRYHAELASELDKRVDASVQLGLVVSNNKYLSRDQFKFYSWFDGMSFKGKTRSMIELNTLQSRRSLKRDDFDVFHPTYYGDYFLNNLPRRPFVITCHDMTHELLQERFIELKRDKYLLTKKKVIMKADVIITVSENTKKDLIDLYQINENKIKVIHLGCSLKRSMRNGGSKSSRPYLLYVGNRLSYKNFDFLLKSLSLFFKRYKEVTLLCAGAGGFTDDERRLIDDYNLSDRVSHTTFKSEEDLANIYSHAQALVFPSLYEGFGIPVLEAFNCGCPVLASNVSSLPEVGGDAALYFDPKDESSLVDQLENVVFDETLRMSMIQKGYTRSEEFSWQKMASETYDLYKTVI